MSQQKVYDYLSESFNIMYLAKLSLREMGAPHKVIKIYKKNPIYVGVFVGPVESYFTYSGNAHNGNITVPGPSGATIYMYDVSHVCETLADVQNNCPITVSNIHQAAISSSQLVTRVNAIAPSPILFEGVVKSQLNHHALWKAYKEYAYLISTDVLQHVVREEHILNIFFSVYSLLMAHYYSNEFNAECDSIDLYVPFDVLMEEFGDKVLEEHLMGTIEYIFNHKIDLVAEEETIKEVLNKLVEKSKNLTFNGDLAQVNSEQENDLELYFRDVVLRANNKAIVDVE